MTKDSPTSEFKAGPNRMARLLVCATFPLIWVGGLVTTYDAGMAVPDWPSTYGYNLFLYPWQSWIAGPWDLFIEHGHRLLGSIVGLIAIGLLFVVWRKDDRGWMKWMAFAALLLVIVQGILGGQRVLRDDRRIAQIHGVVGPLFFALSCMIATFTSKWWRSDSNEGNSQKGSRGLVAAAWLTFFLATFQLVIGSQLRHGIEYASGQVFRTAVLFHVLLAVILVLQILFLAIRVLRSSQVSQLRRPASALMLLVAGQFLLGIASWTVKYGWPAILQKWMASPMTTVQAKSMSQSLIVTGHVAIGALILATSGMLAVRVTRVAVAGRLARNSVERNSHETMAKQVGVPA